MRRFSLNIRECLVEYDRPLVMGVLNVTPDSFYGDSRAMRRDEILHRVESMVADGVDIIDVGACSTRPGHGYIEPETEILRLASALSAVREVAAGIPVSVDTYRAGVARVAVAEYHADIINDVSGGSDPGMFDVAASLKVPYILTHCPGGADDLHRPIEGGDVTAEVLSKLAEKAAELKLLGVDDIIIDPGFGFCKDTVQNYQLLANLLMLDALHLPVLVGVSRKSMICNVVGVPAEDALAGTVAANMYALMQGASILRVHDVLQARQTIEIYRHITNNLNTVGHA